MEKVAIGWVETLGIAGAVLFILLVVMLIIVRQFGKQQEQMLKAVIEKDHDQEKEKNNNLAKLIDKIDKLIESNQEKNDKLIESNHNISLSFIESATQDKIVFDNISKEFSEVKSMLALILKKYDSGMSKVHDRIDDVAKNTGVLLSNTDACLKKDKG